MADLTRIQFKRTTTAGKVPTTGNISDGELAINLADSALYTRNGDKIIQLTGKGLPETITNSLTVNGKTVLNGDANLTEGNTLNFVNSSTDGSVSKHITGTCGVNDGWFIGSGADGSNKGFVELGVIDDGDEEIRVTQRASNNTIRRQAKILNSSGDTEFPGNLSISGNSFVVNNKTYIGAGSTDSFIRNSKSSKYLQLKDDGSLQYDSKPVYWEGRKPTLSELGIGSVIDARQLQQDLWPIATGSGSSWTRVAFLPWVGAQQSRLVLMVANGGNFGSRFSSIDYINVSSRGYDSTATINAGNIGAILEIRRLGRSTSVQPDSAQFRYGIVKNDKGFELWVNQSSYIDKATISLLAIANANYYIPDNALNQSTQPDGWIESSPSRIFDEYNKPDLNDGTQGVLSIANGGTGGTSQAAARNNLGLGTAAIRDVGEDNGQLMQRGAFGLGGSTPAGLKTGSLQKLFQYLTARGTSFFRNEENLGVVTAYSPNLYIKAGDTHAVMNIQYNTGIVKIVSGNNTNITNDTLIQNTLYGTANKPTPSDVNAVDKTGDTMSGDLIVNANVQANVLKATTATNYTPPSQGAYIGWNKNSGSGTTDIINHRGGGKGGFNFWNGTEKGFSIIASISDAGNIAGNNISGNALSLSNSSSNTADSTINITGAQHTPLIINRPSADGNIAIGFKLNGKSLKRVGIDTNGDLKYGESENAALNSMVLTTDTINRDNVSFGQNISVAGDITSAKGFNGPNNAINISDMTIDLNGLEIRYDDPGTVRVYSCVSTGGGAKITNKPSGVNGNFIVYQECIRKANATDYSNRQTLYSQDTKRGFERWYSVTGTSKTWTPWKELIVSDNNVSLGNIGIAGGSPTATSDNGIVINKGSTLRESSTGGLILTSSGSNKTISLFAGGPNVTATGIVIDASTNDTTISYAQGSALRSNSTGALIMSSKPGQSIYLRPQGDSSGTNQLTLNSSGNVDVQGVITTQGVVSSGNISATSDNSMISMGKNGDIALIKKQGSNGKIAIGSNNSFIISKANVTNISNVANTTLTDIFSIDGSGNTAITGGLSVVGQVVSNAPTPTDASHLTRKDYVDSVASKYVPLTGGTMSGQLNVNADVNIIGNRSLYFTKTGSNPKSLRIWHGGDATRGGRIEIDGEGTGEWIAYFQQSPNNTKELRVNGSIYGGNLGVNNIEANGGLQVGGNINTSGGINSNGDIHCGAAYMTTDGNISGSRWGGGWLWDAIVRNDAARLGDARRGPQQSRGFTGQGDWECSNGWLTGFVSGSSDGNVALANWRFRNLQVYRDATGWVDIGSL